MAETSRAQRVKMYNRIAGSEPIAKGTVFYQAYRTQIMSCSPFAIFKHLIEDEAYAHLEHVWAYGEEGVLAYDTFARYAGEERVRFVEAGSEEHMHALATCEYLFTNSALPDYWRKREGQVVINTWHGTPLKTLGRDARDFKGSAIGNAQRNFLLSDFLVMPNRYTAERLLSSYDIEGIMSGKILDVGAPRVDLVLNADSARIRSLLEERVGSSLQDKKIVLYAPTFRSSGGTSLNTTEVMAQHMLEMTADLPDDYVLFFKAHNTLSEYFASNRKMGTRLIFDEFETNELLSAVDVLITDYSSIFFDFICTNRPILFFDYDKNDYIVNHGMYLDMESLPGVECATVDAVIEQLQQISAGAYVQPNRQNALSTFAYNDDGHATQRAVDIIFGGARPEGSLFESRHLLDDDRTSVLFSLGNITLASTTQMLLAKLRDLDPHENRITIAARDVSLIWRECEELHPDVRIIFSPIRYEGRIGATARTHMFQELYDTFFPAMRFDGYVNMKKQEALVDDIVRAANPGCTCEWQFTWADTMKPLQVNRQAKRYAHTRMYCPSADELPALLDRKRLEVLDAPAVRASKKHRLTVLVIAGFDSMNYQLAACAKELKARGHNPIVLVNNVADTSNNLVFLEQDIQLTPRKSFDIATLSFVDLVIGSPLRFKSFNNVYWAIRLRGIPVCSFATLFSSVAMRIYPDLLFTLGEAKAPELESNYLHYNCIATGNPQYDALAAKRKTGERGDIERVIILEQGGYPYGEKGKRQLADTLMRIARDNPGIQFDIKYRYLPESKSMSIHTVSNHLNDYLSDAPDNLRPILRSTILEDIIDDYDGMITMWSTAYLDAMMLDMPLVLIGGFDSVDTFDVRTQRVDDAFAHLAATGCLYDYSEMSGDITQKFRLVDAAYRDHEVYDYRNPSAPVVADLIELAFERLVAPGKRIAPNECFNCTASEFGEMLDSLPLADVTSQAYLTQSRYLDMANTQLQEYVFLNRCMAEMLDLTPLEAYRFVDASDVDPDDYGTFIEGMKNLMAQDFLEIRTRFFTSPEGMAKVNGDRILQDFYFDWLYEAGRLDELENPPVTVITPESREYNLALAALDDHRIGDAFEHLFEFLKIAQSRDVNQLLKCKRLWQSITPFKKGALNVRFYLELFKPENEHLIPYVYKSPEKNPLVSYRMAKALNDAADHEACVVFCDAVKLKYRGQGRIGKTPKQTVRLYERKVLYRLLMRERGKAVTAVQAQE